MTSLEKRIDHLLKIVRNVQNKWETFLVKNKDEEIDLLKNKDKNRVIIRLYEFD